MKTRTYKTKKPSNELLEFLSSEYHSDNENKYTFDNFYWYWGPNKIQKFYGCIVRNNGKLWSNPQI